MTKPPRSLQEAVDQAVAAENARYLADHEQQAEDARTAAVWVRWVKAEQAAGPEAVVLPIALARDIMRLLLGAPTHLQVHPDVIKGMLKGHIDKAAERS